MALEFVIVMILVLPLSSDAEQVGFLNDPDITRLNHLAAVTSQTQHLNAVITAAAVAAY